MSKFPDPVGLPEQVPFARKERKKQVLKAAQWGIFIRMAIIAVELSGYYYFMSSALLLDAISSSLDILTSFALIIFVRLASRPPDENHPFGHGRYEPLAGLQLGLLMIVVGGGMLIQQTLQATHLSGELPLDPRAWMIPFGAMVLLEICYRFMMRAAKQENSPALAADAVHYRIDGLTSLFAAIALLFGAFVPDWSALFDHMGAMMIAVLMVGIGINAARHNLNQLMDKIPEPDFFDRVKKASLRVAGVKDTEKIRIQIYGPDAHVDIDVEVDPQLPVEQAHEISQLVRAEIQKEWPQVREVTVHIEPYYPHDH